MPPEYALCRCGQPLERVGKNSYLHLTGYFRCPASLAPGDGWADPVEPESDEVLAAVREDSYEKGWSEGRKDLSDIVRSVLL